jgi:hypothetical protein
MSCMMMMAQEEKEVEEEPQLVSLRTLESQRVSEDHRPTGTVVGRTGSRLLENQGYGWDYPAGAPVLQDPLTHAYAESLVETSEEEMGNNPLPVPRTLNRQELQSGVKEGRFSVALEAADDGKVYYPNYGNPFRVVSRSAYDLIDRCFMEVEERHEEGTMEAGVGAPKCSGCEDLYRSSGNSVPLLLTAIHSPFTFATQGPRRD